MINGNVCEIFGCLSPPNKVKLLWLCKRDNALQNVEWLSFQQLHIKWKIAIKTNSRQTGKGKSIKSTLDF